MSVPRLSSVSRQARRHLGQTLLLIGASLALLGGLGGCSRKAPGPLECQEMGARVLGIRDSRALADPKVKEALDSFTYECLTAPFDRAVMRCLDQTGDTRICLHDLARRRPELRNNGR